MQVLQSCESCFLNFSTFQAIEIAKLHDHYAMTCNWLRDTLRPCPQCGIPVSEEDMHKHDRGENCPGQRPREGAKYCPLCERQISPDTEQV